jgi:hypothetical protein
MCATNITQRIVSTDRQMSGDACSLLLALTPAHGCAVATILVAMRDADPVR